MQYLKTEKPTISKIDERQFAGSGNFTNLWLNNYKRLYTFIKEKKYIYLSDVKNDFLGDLFDTFSPNH